MSDGAFFGNVICEKNIHCILNPSPGKDNSNLSRLSTDPSRDLDEFVLSGLNSVSISILAYLELPDWMSNKSYSIISLPQCQANFPLC